MNGSYSVIEIDNYGGAFKQGSRNFRNCNHGELLIKVHCTTIHPADLFFLHGAYGRHQPNVFPVIPGIEGSGEIVQVGESVDVNLVGRRATFVANSGKTGSFEGGWAQYVYVDRYQVIIYESNTISFEKIAFAFVNPITIAGFLDTLQKTNVTTVVQNGASGAVGKMFIRLCAKNGIKSINLVRKEEQIEDLKKLGADFVISTSSNGWEAQFEKVALENNALACFECVGNEMTGKILSLMPDSSTVYNYGNLEFKSISGISSADLIFKEKTLTGWWLSTWLKKLKPQEVMKWFEVVRIDLESGSNIFETDWRKEDFGLADIEKALSTYKSNMSGGKVIIRPNGK